MQVIANRSFVGYVDGVARSVCEGDRFDLPETVDWLTAGFVSPALTIPTEPQAAVIVPSESAVLPVAKAKKAAV